MLHRRTICKGGIGDGRKNSNDEKCHHEHLVEHKATVYEAQAILSDLRREVLWQVEADKRKIEQETPVK